MLNTSPSHTIFSDQLEYDRVDNHLLYRDLPTYARFLMESKLEEFATEQLKLVRELNVPFFNYFTNKSDKELIERSMQGVSLLLTALSENNAGEFIDNSMQAWISNQFPLIPIDQIRPEDITLLSFIRRKLFRTFLSGYTQDVGLFANIVEEIEAFTARLDTVSLRVLLNIQQELFEHAQALAHIGSWVLDIPINRLSWSDELFRIYELEPQPEITFDISSFNHPEDAELVQEQMRISRETLQPHDFYYRIILTDGRVKFLHAKGQIIADNNGKAGKMFGTLQDVTSQKLAESKGKNDKKFIEKIANITPSIISVYNIKSGNFLFINGTLKTILGYDTKEVLDKGLNFFIEILHPADLPLISQQNIDSLATANISGPVNGVEKIIEYSYRVRHRDGHYKWLRTYGTVFDRDNEGQVENVINISVDITEKMRNSEELEQIGGEMKRNEYRYHKMIEEVEDYAILSLSREGIIENWNKGVEKIKGYKANEIIGKSFRIFYTPEDQQRKLPEELIEIALKTGIANHEGWRVRKDGSKFWGNVVITALHDNSGQTIGFSKVTRDLTERKKAEDLVRQYAENVGHTNIELEQKNKELESFTYVASHDLKEPLRKIMIFSNRIIENNELSDQSKDFFSRIQKACLRMQTLIDGLLNYSRANLLESNFEETDLNTLVDEVKKELSDIIEDKDVIINTTPLPKVKVERLQFLQLFLNIVSNAIKYGKKDIPLRLKISSSIISRNESSGLDNEFLQFHKISFEDNGIGFEQEYAGRIFELFQRLHGNAEYTGSGLGLAICKRIVEHHKGKICATGIPGHGATFDIYLPVD